MTDRSPFAAYQHQSDQSLPSSVIPGRHVMRNLCKDENHRMVMQATMDNFIKEMEVLCEARAKNQTEQTRKVCLGFIILYSQTPSSHRTNSVVETELAGEVDAGKSHQLAFRWWKTYHKNLVSYTTCDHYRFSLSCVAFTSQIWRCTVL